MVCTSTKASNTLVLLISPIFTITEYIFAKHHKHVSYPLHSCRMTFIMDNVEMRDCWVSLNSKMYRRDKDINTIQFTDYMDLSPCYEYYSPLFSYFYFQIHQVQLSLWMCIHQVSKEMITNCELVFPQIFETIKENVEMNRWKNMGTR